MAKSRFLCRLAAAALLLSVSVPMHDEQRITHPDVEWYRAVQARTAIGLWRDGRTLTLFTGDKSGGSEGMQVGEVADLLREDYDVWDAPANP